MEKIGGLYYENIDWRILVIFMVEAYKKMSTSSNELEGIY